MIHLEDASKVHEIVDKEVLTQDPKKMSRQVRVPLLLATLAAESEEIAVLALGDTGARLRSFAQATAGSQHPDLFEIKGDLLADGHEFASVANEMVKLTSLASEAKLNNVLPHINKIVTKLAGYVPAAKELDDPNKTLNFVRFVNDRARRDSIRRKKKIQTVNIQTIIHKNPDQWNKSGESFVTLARNQTPFEEDIKLCSRRSKGMSEIGASGLASRIADRVADYKMQAQDQYYGFNRMTVTSASIMAGRLMGCDLQPNSMRSFRVVIPMQSVKEIFKAIGEDESEVKNNVVLYEPRLYPVHVIEDIISDRAKTMIDLMESFPEAGGCSIFDHYWCLVPSMFVLNIPREYSKKSKNIPDLTMCFDKSILKTNAVPAILLGERDGKTYFIDYFNG